MPFGTEVKSFRDAGDGLVVMELGDRDRDANCDMLIQAGPPMVVTETDFGSPSINVQTGQGRLYVFVEDISTDGCYIWKYNVWVYKRQGTNPNKIGAMCFTASKRDKRY